MRTKNFKLVVAASILGLTQGWVSADERNLPALNAFGRFMGIGWSTGYHSNADGRFQMVKKNHPASAYPSSQLTHIYHPGYNPVRPGIPNTTAHVYQSIPQGAQYGAPTQLVPAPTLAPSLDSSAPQKVTPEKPTPEVVAPPKPVEPPPDWLRPYLQEGSPSDQKKDSDDLLTPEASIRFQNRYSIER